MGTSTYKSCNTIWTDLNSQQTIGLGGWVGFRFSSYVSFPRDIRRHACIYNSKCRYLRPHCLLLFANHNFSFTAEVASPVGQGQNGIDYSVLEEDQEDGGKSLHYLRLGRDSSSAEDDDGERLTQFEIFNKLRFPQAADNQIAPSRENFNLRLMKRAIDNFQLRLMKKALSDFAVRPMKRFNNFELRPMKRGQSNHFKREITRFALRPMKRTNNFQIRPMKRATSKARQARNQDFMVRPM